MKIIINNSSMQPIYLQIVSQIKAMVIDGSLKEETSLPSVRGMANELKISALTVKKAYDALEQEGFVITVHGKGSYIAKTNSSLYEEVQRKELEQEMESLITKGRMLGMKKEELKDMFELMLDGE